MAALDTLPAKLAQARVRAGLSREQVAVSIGKSFASIRGYEAGVNEPPLRVVIQLADLYRVSLGDLMGEVSDAA